MRTKENIIEQTKVKLKVAIQGYAGAFHEVAARLYFKNKDIEIIPSHTFEELIETAEQKEKADIALMAIENTIAGSLMANYRLLNESNLQIVGEILLRIKQNLMVLPGTRIEELSEVHSHPIALEQCQHFFSQYPQIQLISNADTALSAKMIVENGNKHKGAIASTLAAELYQLEIIADSIETNKQNFTRFLILQKKNQYQLVSEGVNKVSICFSVEHKAGSLHSVLAVLAAYQVNLTKIQSAPIIGKEWQYKFFVDFVMNGSQSYQQALNAIQPITQDIKILGIYKEGKHYDY